MGETAGVGIILKRNAVQIDAVHGDDLNRWEGAATQPAPVPMTPGRSICVHIRSLRDPRARQAYMVNYHEQPGRPKEEIDETWRRWGTQVEALKERHGSIVMMGDYNAEPPDVVTARRTANRTRLTAEQHLERGIQTHNLAVLSRKTRTHHQSTGTARPKGQPRSKAKGKGKARPVAVSGPAPDHPIAQVVKAYSHTAIDLALTNAENQGAVIFMGAIPPISSTTKSGEKLENYHDGIQVGIQIMTMATEPSKRKARPKLSLIRYPGERRESKGGEVVKEATGWRLFTERADPEIRMMLENPRPQQPLPEQVEEGVRRAYEIALDVLEEELERLEEERIARLKKKNPNWKPGKKTIPLGEVHARAQEWMQIEARAREAVDEGKGRALPAELFNQVLMHADIQEARKLPHYERRPSSDEVLRDDIAAAERVAQACAKQSACWLDALNDCKSKIAIRTINDQLEMLMEEGTMSYIAAAMKVVSSP